MINRLGAVVVVVVLTTMFACAPALAQSTFGSIVGSVQDTSGAIVPGVAVKLTNLDENTTRQAASTATNERSTKGRQRNRDAAAMHAGSSFVGGFRAPFCLPRYDCACRETTRRVFRIASSSSSGVEDGGSAPKPPLKVRKKL